MFSAGKEENPETLFLQGQAFLKREDYVKARDCFERAAVQGHVKSCDRLKHLYKHGLGVSVDQRLADLYRRASQSDAAALHSVKEHLSPKKTPEPPVLRAARKPTAPAAWSEASAGTPVERVTQPSSAAAVLQLKKKEKPFFQLDAQ
jgi:TPR repeat protein